VAIGAIAFTYAGGTVKKVINSWYFQKGKRIYGPFAKQDEATSFAKSLLPAANT
jgi:hypothetical protein